MMSIVRLGEKIQVVKWWGTTFSKAQKSSNIKGLRVRSYGSTASKPHVAHLSSPRDKGILQALIVGASQDASIQYVASYNVVFPLYVVVRGPAKHCVLYDMKRICSAYEAKFSQPEKLT